MWGGVGIYYAWFRVFISLLYVCLVHTQVHVGKTKTCSRYHSGRVIVLGDAGAPFPPVGQGVNAAMEAATVLDQCIAEYVN